MIIVLFSRRTNVSNLSTVVAEVMQTTSRPRGTVIKLAEVITFDLEFLQQTPPLFLDALASLKPHYSSEFHHFFRLLPLFQVTKIHFKSFTNLLALIDKVKCQMSTISNVNYVKSAQICRNPARSIKIL